MQELVSVVIPVYNREMTIGRAIDSVLNQTYANIEIIVVDDGSTDNTLKIVEEYNDNRIRIIHQEVQGGANKARNIGIKKSRGKYIAFQDSDDEWLPDKLTMQIKKMEQEKALACFSPYMLYENNKATVVPSDYKNTEKYQCCLKSVLRERNVVGTPTLVIDRDILGLVDELYFDENMPRMQDYELVIRLVKFTIIAYVDQPLVNAYRMDKSITTNEYALYKAVIRLIDKHGDFLDNELFVNSIIYGDIIYDSSENLLAVLNELQNVVKSETYQCKDLMIARMSGLLKCQRDILVWQEGILSRQYKLAVSNLQDKKFSIYGAGKIGQEAYHWFKAKGLRPVCFLVTKCEGNKSIEDIPIISVDEYSNKSDVVVVGIAKKHQMELIDNLIERKYKNFFVYRSAEE